MSMYKGGNLHIRAIYFITAKNKVLRTYLQNLKRIFSNTKTGPVLPRIVRGWPANREYATPVSDAPNRDSIALCRHRGHGRSEGMRKGGWGR